MSNLYVFLNSASPLNVPCLFPQLFSAYAYLIVSFILLRAVMEYKSTESEEV